MGVTDSVGDGEALPGTHVGDGVGTNGGMDGSLRGSSGASGDALGEAHSSTGVGSVEVGGLVRG